jgi:hypothetical protein
LDRSTVGHGDDYLFPLWMSRANEDIKTDARRARLTQALLELERLRCRSPKDPELAETPQHRPELPGASKKLADRK